jgi:hypothetical protein
MGIAISTESQQGQACQTVPCPAGQTALETHFNQFNIQRLLGMSSTGYKRLSALLKSRVPDYDLAAIIINDKSYGGAGGSYAMVSLNSEANEVIAHELMGHTFAKLGDEYNDPYPSFPETEEPNTTHDDQGAKWAAHLKDNESQLTARPNNELDEITKIYAGAHYHGPAALKTDYDASDNPKWYRPFNTCKMRMLGYEFCSVCRDTIIKAIYNKIKPIDSVAMTPSPNDKGGLEVKATDTWSIKVTALQPEQPTNAQTKASTQLMQYQWLQTSDKDKDCKSGQPIPGPQGDTLTSSQANLTPGTYKICARVTDTNADVAILKSTSPSDPVLVNVLQQTRVIDIKVKK